jgi:hypothetical protein
MLWHEDGAKMSEVARRAAGGSRNSETAGLSAAPLGRGPRSLGMYRGGTEVAMPEGVIYLRRWPLFGCWEEQCVQCRA